MIFTKLALQSQIENLLQQKKSFRETNRPWPTSMETLLKGYKVLYKYLYEGGDYPTINVDGSPFPSSSNNTWVGCHACDWERRLSDHETEASSITCDNCHQQRVLFYLSNNRKRRGASWLDTLEDDNPPRERERERERESKITQLRSEIQSLEVITNRTPQQEQELQSKRQELARLEQQTNGNNNKPTNWTPWLIGGGIILVLVIGIVAYLLLRKNNKSARK